MTDGQKRTVGYALRDGQGKLLRRFIITNGGKYLNQWSYYQDGFEVYRENDLDGDRTLDECRWLNGGGTRIAVIKGGKIVGWKRLSAEEASKVLVLALVTGDLGLLDSLMATPDELAAAGVPKEVIDKVTAGAGKRAEAVEALQKGLYRLDPQDGLEPVRRHLSARDSGRSAKWPGARTSSSTRTR